MSWAKLDDQFHAHRKAKRAWHAHPRALGLHLLAMSYCAGHLTDGLVDDEFVQEKLPQKRERDLAAAALVDAGLWTREEDGWRINDWLDYNPSRADTLDKRRKEADRKARARDEASARRARGVRADSGGTDHGVRAASGEASGHPDPTRPDPTTPLAPASGGNDPPPQKPAKNRRADLDTFAAAMRSWGDRHFPGAEPGAVGAAVAWMQSRNGAPAVTAQSLRAFAESNEMWAAQLGLTTTATRGAA